MLVSILLKLSLLFFLTFLLLLALVGKEERNKDFKENLAEDQTGNGAIGPADVKANEIEQGRERISEGSS